MRETRNAQRSIFESFSEHPSGKQFKALSDLIDSQPALLNLLEQDFRKPDTEKTGLVV